MRIEKLGFGFLGLGLGSEGLIFVFVLWYSECTSHFAPMSSDMKESRLESGHGLYHFQVKVIFIAFSLDSGVWSLV